MMVPKWAEQRIAISVLMAASMLACAERHRELMISRAEVPLLNAQPANADEHPYAAFLNVDIGPTLECSGTLIAPGLILTASHCVRCARFIDVTLLGGTPRTQRVMPDRIHVHPDSATTPFDCSIIPLSNGSEAANYDAQLNTKTVWGRDLAILELPQNSTARPLSVLTTPPFGFNPLRALFGQSVTLVGRGNSSIECQLGQEECDGKVMRTGIASLDRYSSTVGVGRLDEQLDGLLEGPQLGPFLLTIDRLEDRYNTQPPLGQQSIILGGDSGGPMIANLSGQARVIGVASAGLVEGGGFPRTPHQISFHTATFLARNASFINGFLGRSTSVADTDGDDVEDSVDNCRDTYNPDQVDFDGDGVGFFCDNCERQIDAFSTDNGSVRILEYDGKPTSEFSQFFNPEQENCNGEAEDEEVLAGFPEPVHGLPRPITAGEYRKYFKLRNANANFYLDTLLNTRRGDVCDPTPCSRASASATPHDLRHAACPLFGICGTRIVDRIGFNSIRANGDEPAKTGTTGFRFCPCIHGGDSEAERRLKCGSSSSAHPCPLGAEHYSLNDPFWRTLSLAERPPTEDVLTDSTFVTPDSSGVAIRNANSVPWNAEDDGPRIAGKPHPSGVLWSHVVSFDGQLTKDVEGTNGSALAELANHYSSPDLTPVVIGPRLPHLDLPVAACFPICPPPWALWASFCPMCGRGIWFLPNRENGVLGILGRNGDDAFDLTDRFSSVARDLLGGTLLQGSRRIMASETDGRLVATRINDRAVVLDAGFRLTGSLRTAGSVMDAQLVSQTGANPLAQGVQQVALAFSAARAEIFAFARLGSAGAAQLFSQSTAGTGWQETALVGQSLSGPKAMVFSERDSSLYVLNQETATSALELFRIDLPTGASIRLDPAIAPAANGFRTALSIASSGELVVASSTSSPPSIDIRGFQVTADELTLTRKLTRSGEVLGGDIAIGSDDVTYVEQGAQGFATHSASGAAFDTCVVEQSNTVVCRPPPVKAQFIVTTDWGTGYCVELKLTNTGTKPTVDWSAEFNLRGTTIYNIWNLNATGATGTVEVKPTADWNRVIAPGASSFALGFCANRASAGTARATDLAAVGTF